MEQYHCILFPYMYCETFDFCLDFSLKIQEIYYLKVETKRSFSLQEINASLN